MDQLTQAAQLPGVQISSSGLHQHCTQTAAAFLQAVLEEVVEQVVAVQAAPIALFKRFQQIIIEESSTIVLPAELKEQWQGCGGGSTQQQEYSEAALKLHVRWDLTSGQLIGPRLSAGRVHERRGPLCQEPLAPGSLYLADRGYWSLHRLRELHQQKVRFCLYPKANTVFWDRQGKRIDLLAALPRTIGQVKVLHVSLGQHDPLPVRLIMVRVPPEVAAQRRERLVQEATDKGRTVSAVQWDLAEWRLIVTNAAAKHLGPAQALILWRERWAAVVVQPWLLLLGCWHDPWRSLMKASAVVRALALECLEVLSGSRRLRQLVTRLRCMMRSGCQVHRRSSEPCLAQLLLEGLDWGLT